MNTIARINTKKGRYLKRRRHATVEPVFGVLTQFLGMRKVNTKGINNANKQFLMAAIAYNLKKYLKFGSKNYQPAHGELKQAVFRYIKLMIACLRDIRGLI